ncbi:MAG: hypothetical protein Q8O04_10695 [Deltaproteobacteria bacterium]|nr:hypothetical protein [Deltaproteobacteria bacterium]
MVSLLLSFPYRSLINVSELQELEPELPQASEPELPQEPEPELPQ